MKFLKRTAIGLILFAVLMGFILLTSVKGVGQYVFNVMVLLVAAFCTYEMVKVFREKEYHVAVIPLILLAVAVYPLIVFLQWKGYLLAAGGFLVLSFGFFVFDLRVTLKDFLATLFIGVYPLMLISLATLMTEQYGMMPLLVALGGALCSDAFAYYAGSVFKGPKIFPKISPKKTYSGCIGGVFGGIIGTMLIYALFEVLPIPMNDAYRFTKTLQHPIIFYIFVGVALAVVSELGDLAASRIKRELGVKDYSHALGAHGGAMDRLDSIIFAVIFMTALMPFLPEAVA